MTGTGSTGFRFGLPFGKEKAPATGSLDKRSNPRRVVSNSDFVQSRGKTTHDTRSSRSPYLGVVRGFGCWLVRWQRVVSSLKGRRSAPLVVCNPLWACSAQYSPVAWLMSQPTQCDASDRRPSIVYRRLNTDYRRSSTVYRRSSITYHRSSITDRRP